MNDNKQNGRTDSISKEIENLIDEEIEKLLSEKDLDSTDSLDVEFDEFGVYERIIDNINTYESLRRRRRFMTSFKWALGCIGLFLILGVGYSLISKKTFPSPTYHELYADKGNKVRVVLPDGSRVWLNSDSKLSYSSGFNEQNRDVILEGEAYFEVTKNRKKPFKVHTNKISINVLGTSFNVSAYSSDEFIKTTLDEGSIIIEDLLTKNKNYTLTPGQTAYYVKENQECSIVEDQYSNEVSSWRFNQLAFRNTTLKDIVNILTRKFDVEFVVKDPELKSYTYTFTTKSNDLKEILFIMKSITPIKVDQCGNRVLVSKL